MAWSFTSRAPVYMQIVSRIRADILGGVYQPDQQIPAVRQLALTAGVNPNTMQRAFAVLEAEQLFITRGTIGRFMAYLIEETKGVFPLWLAPVQVKVLPVSDKSMDYAAKVTRELMQQGIRAELDERNEKIGYKIRYARQEDKVPYMLIIGEKEITEGTLAVRDRATDQTTSMSMEELVSKLEKEIEERV